MRPPGCLPTAQRSTRVGRLALRQGVGLALRWGWAGAAIAAWRCDARLPACLPARSSSFPVPPCMPVSLLPPLYRRLPVQRLQSRLWACRGQEGKEAGAGPRLPVWPKRQCPQLLRGPPICAALTFGHLPRCLRLQGITCAANTRGRTPGGCLASLPYMQYCKKCSTDGKKCLAGQCTGSRSMDAAGHCSLNCKG